MRTISSLFIFFTKRFCAHKKHQNVKQTTFTLLEVCVREKLLSVCLILLCWFIFACDVFLFAQNLFVKNKSRFEIVLINPFHYTTFNMTSWEISGFPEQLLKYFMDRFLFYHGDQVPVQLL